MSAEQSCFSRAPDPTTGEPTVSFTYTATGKRQTMTDGSGTTNYTYDSMDRPITKATPEGTLNYSYDAAGHVASISSTNSNGASMAYTYDSLNRLETVVDSHLGTTTYTYDDASNVATVTYPNGVQTAFTYDPLNRVSALATQTTGYSYQRDSAGKLTNGLELSNRQAVWSYDGINRLTGESISAAPSGKNGNLGYGLDPVGNRTSATSTVSGLSPASGSFNADDELGSETYDNNGNVTATGGKTFAYDAENHLVSMGSTAALLYDGDGNRVAKTVSGVTTKYLVDDLNPTGYPQIVDELTNGVVSRTYTYGLQRISQYQVVSSAWTPSFYGYDGGGNVRNLTNSAGTITDTYEYDAFGNSFTVSGSTPNNMLYQGEEWDPDLGLYYLRARYMNPLSGRFGSRDPGNGYATDPVTLHKYLYANGDPVNGSDPTGWEDAEAYPNLLARISVSAPVIGGLRAASAAIACALVWEGTKTYAETVAGPFGTVTMVAPCIWLGRKTAAPPAPPSPLPFPPFPFPIPGTPPNPWPPRCKDLRDAVNAAKALIGSFHPAACQAGMSPSQLQDRYDAWVQLGQARAHEDQVCWNGGNENHQKEEANAWDQVANCSRLLQ